MENSTTLSESVEKITLTGNELVIGIDGRNIKIPLYALDEYFQNGALKQLRGAVKPNSPVPTGDFWVIAAEPGTYTHFNNTIVPEHSFAVISRVNNNWTSTITDLDVNSVQKTDIIDNLLTEEVEKPLSAKQGKILKDLIGGTPDSLPYFLNGNQQALFLSEYLSSDPALVSGIITTSNGLRSSTGYVSMRNYVLGDAKYMEVFVNATSNVAGDAFIVGIKADNSVTVLLSRTTGSTRATIDVSDYDKVSFSLGVGSTHYVKFFAGVPTFSKDNVKKYIDNVGSALNGIVTDPTIIETLIDNTYAGPERLNNTVLRANGATGASTGITTFLKLNVRNHFAINIVTTFPTTGATVPYNAGLLGYRPNGEIVNIVPLASGSSTPINAGFNIEEFDYISVCVTVGGLTNLKLTLIRKNRESEPVKKYIDNRVARNGSISTVNNRFKLTRIGQILLASQTSLPTIYWPSIIRTDKIVGALGTYYMYFSTDHGGVNSKINLAYSNNLTNWTEFGTVVTALNQLGVVGESETPSVVYDEFFGKFRMYWQTYPDPSGLGYAQSTQISESEDGINWTYVKTALDIPLDSITGNGHNGYFDILKHSNIYIATHLMGGGEQSYLSRSYSYDGLNWFTSPFVVTAERHGAFPDASGAAGVGNFSEVAHFRYNGRNYAVSRLGTNVGGASGTDPKVVNLGIVELCDDHVTIAGKGELLKEMNETNETNDIRSIRPFQDIDGTMYIIYNCNNRFFLSKLEVHY